MDVDAQARGSQNAYDLTALDRHGSGRRSEGSEAFVPPVHVMRRIMHHSMLVPNRELGMGILDPPN